MRETEGKIMRYLCLIIFTLLLKAVTIVDAYDTTLPVITSENANEVRLLGTFWHSHRTIFPEFSPTGRYLSSYTYPNQAVERDVYIWDMATMTLQDDIVLDIYPEDALFSPTQDILAIESNDTIQLWDAASSRFTFDFSLTSSIVPMIFSPDGMLLAKANDLENTLTFWRTDTGEAAATLDASDLLSYDFSAELLAIGGVNGVTLFNFDGEQVGSLTLEYPIADVVFTPDGETLITQSETYNPHSVIYRFIDVATMTERATFREWRGGGWTDGIYGNVLSSHLSADGNTFAFNNDDEETTVYRGVNIVDIVTGEIRFQTDVTYCRPSNVIFSPDNRLVAACTENGIQILDINTGHLLTTLPANASDSQTFTLDGSMLAVQHCENNDTPVELWDTYNGIQLTTLPGYCDYYDQITLSPDGSTLLVNAGQFLLLYGIPTDQRPAYGSVPARVAPSAINVRAAPSLDAQVIGTISGDVAVSGRDESGQFVYLSSHYGWVRAGVDYLDLGTISIEDLPIIDS